MALGLALVLALAACGGDDQESSTDAQEDTDAAVEETAAADDEDEGDAPAGDDDVALPDSDRCDETIGVTDDSITVTVITDLSGPISQLGGIDHAEAFAARFETINEAGGIDGYQIDVNIVDGQYNPVEIANQYEQARTESAMIGDVEIDAREGRR